MSDVRVTQSHDLPVDEAVERVTEFEDMIKKYGVKSTWKGGHADLKGMGVKGSIDVTDSDVTVVLKLGMMAKAAGVDPKRLEGSIRKRLAAAFED